MKTSRLGSLLEKRDMKNGLDIKTKELTELRDLIIEQIKISTDITDAPGALFWETELKATEYFIWSRK